MLGSLLKYEFKATGRVLLPLFLIYLALAVLVNIFGKFNQDALTAITLLVFMAMAVACTVMAIILLIQRFNVNLLKDEGYLMFTLPVSTGALIWSKFIVALVWAVIGWIISLLGFFLMMVDGQTIGLFSELFAALQQAYAAVGMNGVWFSVEILLLLLAGYGGFILSVYLSLSVGQLPIAGKHRGLASWLTFFIIYVISMIISNLLPFDAFDSIMVTSETIISGALLGQMGIILAVSVIEIAIMFFITNFILKRKLNLE